MPASMPAYNRHTVTPTIYISSTSNTLGTGYWAQSYVGSSTTLWEGSTTSYNIGSKLDPHDLYVQTYERVTPVNRLMDVVTPEEQAARDKLAEERRIRDAAYIAEKKRLAAIEAEKKEAAKKRSLELLFSHLTTKEAETFKEHGFFEVIGGETGTVYRIRNDPSLVANIDVMNGPVRTHRLCAHADRWTIPIGDQLLSQKVMLEVQEREFLRIANYHG